MARKPQRKRLQASEIPDRLQRALDDLARAKEELGRASIRLWCVENWIQMVRDALPKRRAARGRP